MSMAEFVEFRKKVAESIMKMKQDVRRYPTFNSDYNRAKSLNHFGKDQRYGVELWLGRKCLKTKLPSAERCCIAMKFGSGWLRCSRVRSRRSMNDVLGKVAVMKRLNVGICREATHLGVCLFHWRLIRYAKQGFVLTEEQLRSWEACETQAEKSDRDEDVSDIMAIESSSTSSDHDDSDDDGSAEKNEEDMSEKTKYNWRKADLKRRKSKSLSDEGDGYDEHRDSEEDEKNGLCTLSAASLRRYRKYFMIPTKASASKHAMLEGVENHFEKLPVRASDTVVHFIYVAKNRLNTIE